MTVPSRSQPGTELAQRIQTHLALKDSSPGFHLSDDDLTLIAERLAGPDREALRDLVDIVWNEATESTAVPSTKWANKLIDRWNTRAGARGARVNEISRLRAGLQAVVDCKDSVARSAIREHCASILSQSPEDARCGVQSAAERVVWFDWSGNDPDAVAAIDALRSALSSADCGPDIEEMTRIVASNNDCDKECAKYPEGCGCLQDRGSG